MTDCNGPNHVNKTKPLLWNLLAHVVVNTAMSCVEERVNFV